jgi:hypothetical protein
MFENLLTITDPRPQIATATLTPGRRHLGHGSGDPGDVRGQLGEPDRELHAGYFTFRSSNDTVAIAGEGVVNVVGVGDAAITAGWARWTPPAC